MQKYVFFPTLSLVLLSFFASCTITVSYKSTTLRKNHRKAYQSLLKLRTAMEVDYKKIETVHQTLETEFPQSMAKAKKLKPLLKELKKILKKVKKEEALVLRIKHDVDRITKGKKKIKSNQREWDIYKELKNQTEKAFDRAENLKEQYESKSKRFQKKLNALKVKKVSHSLLKGMRMKLQKLNRSLNDADKRTQMVLKKARLSESKREAWQTIKSLIDEAKKLSRDVSDALRVWEQKLKGKKVFYTIENQDPVALKIKKIQKELKQIQKQIKAIKKQ